VGIGRAAELLPTQGRGHSFENAIGFPGVPVVMETEDNQFMLVDVLTLGLIDRVVFEFCGLIEVVIESRFVRDDEVLAGRDCSLQHIERSRKRSDNSRDARIRIAGFDRVDRFAMPGHSDILLDALDDLGDGGRLGGKGNVRAQERRERLNEFCFQVSNIPLSLNESQTREDNTMRRLSNLIQYSMLLVGLLAGLQGYTLYAQQPFLSESQWTLMREEASGLAPYENLRSLTRLHRVPATPEFDQAAEFMLLRAKEYGLQGAHAEQFPIDGKIHYGLMRSHLGWSVEGASLWELEPEHTLLGDWATAPIRLADYSHSADVDANLVDVGAGTSEANYTNKQVRGKIVLADGGLTRVQAMAVMEHGAAGIVSDMPNQTTAWSGLDTTIVRWGHLDAKLPKGFAFMVSRETAAALRAQLTRGRPVTLSAHVKAEVGPGHWTVVTATIPGTDPQAGEVVYSCHLDHQRPGANDNGSGCVTILESARLLNSLIKSGKLPRPLRTLRFIWGPEVEGTMAFLSAHPDIRRSVRADVHMDMVGGDPYKNKSILHVTETPWSLPSFVTDVGELFAETIRNGAAVYAEDGSHAEAAVVEDRNGSPGTRNQFLSDRTPYAEGSDHDDYDSSTIAVPSLYLRDWPDIYIHTDHDTLEQIDPTKLRRVALLGAASGYTYATIDAEKANSLLPFFAARAQRRLAEGFDRAQRLAEDSQLLPQEAWYEARNLLTQMLRREQAELRSVATYTRSDADKVASFTKDLADQAAILNAWINRSAAMRGAGNSLQSPVWRGQPDASRIPERIAEFGPLTFQNDDVLLDRLGSDRMKKIKLLDSESNPLFRVQDRGALYAYEIVNFVDGKRSVGEIRDAVAAEFGPIPLDLVADYLKACEEAKIVALHQP
jgi:aminopeptidase YwaD